MNTKGLVSRVLAGDTAAERELYDVHVDRVYRLAHRLAGDSEAAADYTQETFVRVFDKLHTFRGEAALSTWVTSVAYSVVYNGLRKRRRKDQQEVPLEPYIADRPVPRADPDLRASLKRAIDDLPDGYRTVFVMHDIEGYKHREIADALGIQEGTSKAQLSRARAKLRTVLAPFAEEWMA